MLNLDEIRNALESNRQVLLKRISVESKESHKLPPSNPTRSDLGRHYDTQQRKRLLRSLAKSQLAQVKNALKRLESGDYGKCVNCGKQIHPNRLKVMPSATLCISCKHQEEW